MSYEQHFIFTSVSTIKKPHTHTSKTQKWPSTWEKSSEASGQELQCGTDQGGQTEVRQTETHLGEADAELRPCYNPSIFHFSISAIGELRE